MPRASKARALCEALGVKILQVGPGWAALEKPCGVSVHNAPGQDLVSLLERLLETEPEILGQTDGVGSVHAVHRLDADTSGVVLFAFGKEAARQLTRQFEEKRVQKKYTALLHGLLEEKGGFWCFPLAKEAGGRSHAAGSGRRQPCETRYEVMARTCRYTLICCSPLTGRKHQIRRHACLAGHTIIGDRRYGSKRALSVLKERFDYKRLSLHAWHLTFTPPGSDSPLTIVTAQVPQEMRRLMDIDSRSQG